VRVSPFRKNESLRHASANCAARATLSTTRNWPALVPRVSRGARITENSFDSTKRALASTDDATVRVRGHAEAGREGAGDALGVPNRDAVPNVDRTEDGVCADRCFDGVCVARGVDIFEEVEVDAPPGVVRRADEVIEGVCGAILGDTSAPSAPRAVAERPMVDVGVLMDACFLASAFGEVGTHVGSFSLGADGAFNFNADAARAFEADKVVRSARRGREEVDCVSWEANATAGVSMNAASAESCFRNSRITSSLTSSWPSCLSCSRTASTEIPARVSGAGSMVPPAQAGRVLRCGAQPGSTSLKRISRHRQKL
jgi:hypothetical protein